MEDEEKIMSFDEKELIDKLHEASSRANEAGLSLRQALSSLVKGEK